VSRRALGAVVTLVLAAAVIGAPGAFAQTPAPSDGDDTVAGQQPGPEQDGKAAAPKPPPAEPKSQDAAPVKPKPEEPKAAKPPPAKPQPAKPEPKAAKPAPAEPKAPKPAPAEPKAAKPKPASPEAPKPAPQAPKPATSATDAVRRTPAEPQATASLPVARATPPTAKDPRPTAKDPRESLVAAAPRHATGPPTLRANQPAVPHATTTYVPEAKHARASPHQPSAAGVTDPSPAPTRRTPASRLGVASATAAASVDRRRTALPTLTARPADAPLTLLLAIAVVGLVALLFVREFSRGTRSRRY